MIGKTNASAGGSGAVFPTSDYLVKATYGKSSLGYQNIVKTYSYDISKRYYVVASCYLGTANYSSALYTLENDTCTLLDIQGTPRSDIYSVRDMTATGGTLSVTYYVTTTNVGMFCALIPID